MATKELPRHLRHSSRTRLEILALSIETETEPSADHVHSESAERMQQAYHVLQSVYGYDEFRLSQADIIQSLLDGDDVLTLMPTGGGKSLCYQIPALVLDGVGIIVSPLIALMHDQVNALKQLGVNAAYLNSSLDYATRQQTERDLRQGKLDLIYIAPERLLKEQTLNLLDQLSIALFAIDEAHCVSQWGHDFRKEYQQLSKLHERYPHVPRIALTATADQRTRKEIIEQLNLNEANVFINSFDRPNIHYAVSDGQNPRQALWRFIDREHGQDAGIVYCLSRKKVESTASWLTEKGREALPYHAGLGDEVRRLHQERFLREDGIIIVATIAFGMGIDKPDVRFVAHLSLPKSIEAYYQETGRAGRDGEPANAWMGYGLQDVIFLRQMVQNTDANEQFKRIAHHKLEAMLGLCELTTCRRQTLLAYFQETLSKPCGNCDNCISPPQTWDASTVAQKALSCIYRTGQRFGVNYIIDVLLGKQDERIQRNGHDRLSTYGIGTELGATEWRSVFRQIIALGYIDTDMEGHGALQLTEKCRTLLRGESNLELRKIQNKEPSQEKSAVKSKQMRSFDEPLYEALRQLRMTLATELAVPAYIIFHDKTLQDMARIRPASENEMRHISGVGEQKLKQYGNDFLETIKAHALPALLRNSLNDTTNETLYLHLKDNDVERIAQLRSVTTSTVYTHFANAVEAGLLEAFEILPIDDTQFSEIVNTIEMLDISKQESIKPVYEALNESYDYGILKCVMASL